MATKLHSQPICSFSPQIQSRATSKLNRQLHTTKFNFVTDHLNYGKRERFWLNPAQLSKLLRHGQSDESVLFANLALVSSRGILERSMCSNPRSYFLLCRNPVSRRRRRRTDSAAGRNATLNPLPLTAVIGLAEMTARAAVERTDGHPDRQA
jgi:hypothetical protein